MKHWLEVLIEYKDKTIEEINCDWPCGRKLFITFVDGTHLRLHGGRDGGVYWDDEEEQEEVEEEAVESRI